MTRWLFLEKLLPAHRRAQRGQTLVIFAFLAVFLLLLLGLVLDTARLFILAAEAERTAEAASLAGALYMPTYFNALAPDGQDALNRACATAQANGVTACPVGVGQIGADVEVVSGNQYELQVTVTLQADVFFLSYVAPNLASATVTRTAVAQYLPPIQLGSRAYAFGDETEADKVFNGGNRLQNFWARLNGPYEVKDHGDAYTPKWQEGPDDARTTTDLSTNVVFDRWPSCTLGQCNTNHPQFGVYPNFQLNGDLQPSGFTGDQGLAGYNYEIVVPSGTTPLEIQIFNPAFDPPYALDANTADDLGDACLDPLYKISSCTYTTAGVVKTDLPGEYLQMDYALYYVPLSFERATDTLLTTFYAPSLDLYPNDLSKHGCAAGQAFDPDGKTASLNGTPGCVSLPSYITYSGGVYTNHWYPLPATSSGGTYIITNPGTYRLALEATGQYGYHQYAVKVTDTSGNPPPAGVRLWAWNDMCVFYNQSGTNAATFDLGEIPAAYAGKTLTFSLFDPGDAGGPVGIEILDPSGNPVQLPAWVRTVAGSGGTEIDASNGYYNALWLRLPVPIPATYNPTAGNDWWQVKYIATNPTDTVTASITLSGSPIHLVSEVVG